MAEPDLIYKITILNLLSKSDIPMTGPQISSFLVDGGYTDYFTGQDQLAALEERGLIIEKDSEGAPTYELTATGAETLYLLHDRITPAIEEDTRKFFEEQKLSMKQNHTITAAYDGVPGGGYLVHLKLSQEGHPLIDLSLQVMSREQAEVMCMNFRVRYEDVYASLMDTLVQ